MKLTLAIDMDETMADTTKEINRWYEREFGHAMTEAELHAKDFGKAVPPEHAGAVKRFLNTPGFFRHLEPFPDAIEVVRSLNERYDVFIVSAAMEFPNSLKDKVEWLDEFFPFLNWRQYCLCGDKSVVQTDLMIDDRSRNFIHLKDARTYLYTAHHNVLETAYERVNNWQEVATRLL
jgi:5'(3')-deoxyribonucleotidase